MIIERSKLNSIRSPATVFYILLLFINIHLFFFFYEPKNNNIGYQNKSQSMLPRQQFKRRSKIKNYRTKFVRQYLSYAYTYT